MEIIHKVESITILVSFKITAFSMKYVVYVVKDPEVLTSNGHSFESRTYI